MRKAGPRTVRYADHSGTCVPLARGQSSIIKGHNVSQNGGPIISVASYRDGQKVRAQERASAPLAQIFDDIAASSDSYVVVADAREIGHAGELLAELSLPEALKRDVTAPSPRPRVDKLGDTSVTVVRPASYSDEEERISLSTMHLVLTTNFLVVLHEGASTADGLFAAATPDILRYGTRSAYLHVLDRIAVDYLNVAEELTTDVDEIELQVFGGDMGAPEHIYRLGREVLELQRAVIPLADSLEDLAGEVEMEDTLDEALQLAVRHLQRKIQRSADRARELQDQLASILQVNAALIGQKQNEDTKKISAWAAILVVPTLVAGIYGMNFHNMPELGWRFGYPLSLALMAGLCLGLYAVFKRKNWL